MQKIQIEVRSPEHSQWPLVVYVNGKAVKIIHSSGLVEDVPV